MGLPVNEAVVLCCRGGHFGTPESLFFFFFFTLGYHSSRSLTKSGRYEDDYIVVSRCKYISKRNYAV